MGQEIALISQSIERRIQTVRDHKVLLDSDLAELYGVEVRALNQAVKRNIARFPDSFVFQLTEAESAELLRSQIVISKAGRGGRRYLPMVFTEHGALMAATVLKSQAAIDTSVYVIQAFTRLQQAVRDNQKLFAKLNELEEKLEKHDSQMQRIVQAIRELAACPDKSGKHYGFLPRSSKAQS